MLKNQYTLLNHSTSDLDDSVLCDDENVFLLTNIPHVESKSKVKSRNSWKNVVDNNNDSRIDYYERQSTSTRSSSAESGNRSKNAVDSSTTYIERKIHKDDSLRNLAIQYGVTVADLKRVNGLLSEQEFYGRDVLKIPVRRYGMFTDNQISRPDCSLPETQQLIDIDLISEQKAMTKSLDNTAPPSHLVVSDDFASGSRNTAGDQRNNSNMSTTKQPDSGSDNDLLRKVDKNLNKAKRHVEEKEAAAAAVVADSNDCPLADIDVYVSAARKVNMRLSWWQRNVTHFCIVILLIFIVIFIPLCVVLYKMLYEEEQN